MPTSKDTRRRQSKKPSTAKKTAAQSSAISTVSSSSASSNATVTSRSIFPSSLRPSKRPDAIPSPIERPSLNHTRSRSTNDSNKENFDVFAYIEEEEDDDYNQGVNKERVEDDSHEEPLLPPSSSVSARLMDRPEPSPRYSDLEVRTIQNSAQHTWGRESLHSDSGISDMRSSSPDQESPVLQKKLPTLPDEPWAEVDGQDARYSYPGTYSIQDSPDLSEERRSSAFHHKHWPSLETNHGQSPEAYYPQSPARLTDVPQSYMSELYPRPSNQLVRGISQELTTRRKLSKTGYELLATNIDSRGDAVLRPIYRKFETLNNRMLLYLQDEICEMEDQLRELDDAIAHEGQHDVGKRVSRRAEAKLPSQLQWHRLDLLGRSFAKVEQYSKCLSRSRVLAIRFLTEIIDRALTSYSNLTKSLDPASQTDIAAYRAWIAEHTPIDEQESEFLQKDSDLLSIVPQPGTKISSRAGTALETPIVLVAFALLSTVVVFKVVPQILGRLVISAMVGLASLCALSPEVMTNLRCVRDWGKAIATYVVTIIILSSLAVLIKRTQVFLDYGSTRPRRQLRECIGLVCNRISERDMALRGIHD